MKTITSLVLFELLGATGAFADQQLATSTIVSSYWTDASITAGESDIYNHSQTAPPGSSLADNGATSEAPWGSATGSVNLYYGSCGMTASAAALGSAGDQILGSGSGSLSGQWISQITVNTPGMEGQPATIRSTFHASGAVSGTGSNYYVGASANYSYSVSGSDGSAVGFSGAWDTQTYAWNGDGSPNRTFTLDTTCTVGQPCEITHSVTWNVGAGASEPDFGDAQDGTAQANGSLNLTSGSFVVLDPDGNRLDYTADSPSGSAQAVTYPAGGPLNTFSLTNTAAGSNGTTVQLLDGAPAASTQVTASFVTPQLASAIKLVSDVLELTGSAGTKTVVQMSYNPSAVTAAGLVESQLRLGWLAPLLDRVIPAVFGNSGPSAPQFKMGVYNPATDFQLGMQGLDMVNHTVWAVVDHNSEFMVTTPETYLAVHSLTRPAAHTTHLNCYGQAGAPNHIETSTDLNNWTPLATVTADASGAFSYDDTDAAATRKYYRLSNP